MGALAYQKIGLKELESLLNSDVNKWNAYKYSVPYKVELVVTQVDFEDLTLDCPDLNLVSFRGCTFTNCLIKSSNLNYSLFNNCYFYKTSLVRCSVSDAKISDCFFHDCEISGSSFIQTEFYNTDLTGVSGSGNELEGAYLLNSPLPLLFKIGKIERTLESCNSLLNNKDPEDDLPK